MNAVQTAGLLLGAVLGAGGTAALVSAVANRRVVRADASARLTDAAVEMVERLAADETAARADAAKARADAAVAREDAAATRTQMAAIRADAEALAARMYALLRAISDPTATLEGLRALVGRRQ